MRVGWRDASSMAQEGRTMRVRTVFDLGTDAIYLKPNDLLLVDADLTEAEYHDMVRMAAARYPAEPTASRRHLRAL